MYISVVKDGLGGKNQYVLLKESYRTPDGKNRSRVVRNFGNLEKLREGDPDALEKLKALYAGERERKVRAESAAKTQAVQALFEESGWTELDEPRPFALLYYGHAPLRRIWKELGLDRKIRQLKQGVDIEPAVFFLVALTIMGASFEERDFFLGDPAAGLTERHLAAARTFLEENRDGLQCWLTKKLQDRFGRAVSVSPPILSMPEGGLQMADLLAQAFLGLIIEQLAAKGVSACGEAVARTLSRSKVLVMKTPEGSAQFLNVTGVSNLRRPVEPAEIVRMADIMRACGLSPVPAVTGRQNLARTVGTRWASDTAAVPALVWNQL